MLCIQRGGGCSVGVSEGLPEAAEGKRVGWPSFRFQTEFKVENFRSLQNTGHKTLTTNHPRKKIQRETL